MCVINAVAARSGAQEGINIYEDNEGREERSIVDPTPKRLGSEKFKIIPFPTNLAANLKNAQAHV